MINIYHILCIGIIIGRIAAWKLFHTERNVTQYDYVDFVNDSGLEAPSEEALAVRQFHEQLDQAVHYTPLWYAVLEKEDGDNWRNLTRKLLGGAVNQEEFVQDAAQYLNFTAQ